MTTYDSLKELLRSWTNARNVAKTRAKNAESTSPGEAAYQNGRCDMASQVVADLRKHMKKDK